MIRARETSNLNCSGSTTLRGDRVIIPVFVPRTTPVEVLCPTVTTIYGKSSKNGFEDEAPPSYDSIFPSDVVVENLARY
ncbi:unnamed protein product [Orchesella dallaii]|uniref:Uncharacterized protein n=1 Tax=Orchesella dallaii TaxID=48710 RepID=A0ABP1QMV1_9HEXA